MIFPLEDYLVWAERYDLKVVTGVCPKCKQTVVTDIPFAIKGYRGLKSADHGCGERLTRKTIVPTSKDEIEYWAQVAQSM